MAEADGLSLPLRARERRSHAERTAETRARIIAAVVESIAEVGFQRTTASEITRRAGVTWGAAQHHFGGKDGILVAVLQDSFQRFEARLEGLDAGGPLRRRVSHFVDRAWQHFSSASYRSTFEILLNALGREHAADEPRWQEQMFRAWDRVWMRVFGDAPVPRRQHYRLQHYTVSVLSGLAATLALEGPGGRLPPGELELLKQTLERELS